jgi:hypothetical protein
MNADLVKTGRLRRSPQGQGTLYPVPQPLKSRQQKPVFQVLENSATSDAVVTKSEHERIANPKQRPITSTRSFESISYAFSFPLCDLLICEFPEFVTNSEQTEKKGHTEQTVTSVTSNIPVKISRVMHYIYQKVVRRKPVPYQPSPKNPSYLLCYVEEELECGHKVTVHPSSLETLTARKRNCHECSSWFGGLKLPEGKKANASILRSYERIKKQAGKSLWPLLFAAACACVFVYFAHPWAKTRVFCSTCTPQTSFRVLKSYNKRDFLMQRVVDGIPEPPEMRRFDEDSPLEMGFTVTYLRFEDRGSVWSVRGIDPYFRLERDEKGWPTLPPNCYHSHLEDLDRDHVVCNGVPKWD